MTGPMFYTQVEGDFVVGGASSRVRDGGVVGDTVTVSLTGIPAGATVVQAFANWSYMGDLLYSTNDVSVDGTAVTGTLAGYGENDLVWGYDYGMSYTADVSGLVTGNGDYDFRGIVDDRGKEWIGEGVSIVAVYRLDGMANRAVHIYHGYMSTTSGDSEASLGFNSAYEGGDAHFFTNAIDGQEGFTDDFLFNGTVASDDFGLSGFGNAFQGDLGLGPRDYNYYDHAEGDASAYMDVGDMNVRYKTEGFTNNGSLYTDAIGHSMAAVSFGVVPEPSLLLAAGLGLAALARQRRARK